MFWIIYTFLNLVFKTVAVKNNTLGKQSSEVRENTDNLCLCSAIYAKATSSILVSLFSKAHFYECYYNWKNVATK